MYSILADERQGYKEAAINHPGEDYKTHFYVASMRLLFAHSLMAPIIAGLELL